MAKTLKVANCLQGEGAFPTFLYNLPVFAGTATSIKAGDLVIKDAGHAGYVSVAATGCDSTSVILGVASRDSTDTVAANGTVDVWAGKVLVLRVKAAVPANLAASLLFDKYCLNVSGSDFTLDESNNTNGIMRLISYDNTTDGNCIATLATNW